VSIHWPEQNASAKSSPGTQGMPQSFNQTMAYLALTQIHDAEKTYSERYARGFSASLGQLGPPPSWLGTDSEHAGLFDPMHDSRGLADGAVTYSSLGYRVAYIPGNRDSLGKVTSYQVTARPIEYGKTGTRSFWMDETGAIHQTEADRSASPSDQKAQLN
jgi:hypothetical protein